MLSRHKQAGLTTEGEKLTVEETKEADISDQCEEREVYSDDEITDLMQQMIAQDMLVRHSLRGVVKTWLQQTATDLPTNMFVGWLLSIPATCECISGTDQLGKFYMLPH